MQRRKNSLMVRENGCSNHFAYKYYNRAQVQLIIVGISVCIPFWKHKHITGSKLHFVYWNYWAGKILNFFCIAKMRYFSVSQLALPYVMFLISLIVEDWKSKEKSIVVGKISEVKKYFEIVAALLLLCGLKTCSLYEVK